LGTREGGEQEKQKAKANKATFTCGSANATKWF
jgi:hypothetical protein